MKNSHNLSVFGTLTLIGIATVLVLKASLSVAQENTFPPQPQRIAQATEPPGLRTPVATINPDQPIQIRVVNASDIDVVIVSRLTNPPSDERSATPGQSVIFGRLHTSFLPPPFELTVFPDESNINIDATDLDIENNEIIVTVSAVPGVSGDLRVIRVDESGDVYLY